MSTKSSDLSWPALEEPFAGALRDAVAFIENRVTAVGVLVSGTIVRGDPDPSSDLDIVVLHTAPFRQRIQKRFRDVPAEIFINPPLQIRRDFKREHHLGRPIMAHMIATGHVVVDRDPLVGLLRRDARALLAAGPPDDASVNRLRYLAATRFEDARDKQATEPGTAQLILSQAVADMLRYFVRAAGGFIPRDKDLLDVSGRMDPAVAALARETFQSISTDPWDRACELAQRTIGVQGFYEWESDREAIEAPGSTI